MLQLHREKLNGRKVKLFIESLNSGKDLIDSVKILYSNDCIEVFEVNRYAWIDDRAEFKCYGLFPQELPVLLICDSKKELQVKEVYRQFTV